MEFRGVTWENYKQSIRPLNINQISLNNWWIIKYVFASFCLFAGGKIVL